MKHTFASFLSRDTTYDVIHNIWRLSTPQDPTTADRSVVDDLDHPDDLSGAHVEGDSSPLYPASKHLLGASPAVGRKRVLKKETTCACSVKGEHFSETALDSVFPSTPEKIYNLMFTSGFSKDFMSGNQKLMGECQKIGQEENKL